MKMGVHMKRYIVSVYRRYDYVVYAESKTGCEAKDEE